ncbi:MAG: hypothetical protein Q8O67_11205 [Deltaproteobacteria bacterium]|nr:hypothetical protein [Deltaproteobacteria bacterium]
MRALVVITAIGLGSSCVVPMPAEAAPAGYDDDDEFDDDDDDDAPPFYADLAPHGDWWWHDHWGWVWSPYVDAGWRPYTRGRWVWADGHGWLWDAAEPFGWVSEHYGRWTWMDDAGWVWVPGRVWAPAWVVWRTAPGFIGWAPLGPLAVWVPGHGFARRDIEVGISPWGWVFVDGPNFLAPNLVTVVHSHAHTNRILPRTRVRHRPERGDHGQVVHRGLDRDEVERVTKQRVIPRRVVDRDRDDDSDDDRELRRDVRRVQPDDEVRVKRARQIERRAGNSDLPTAREERPPPKGTPARPLRTPDRDDVDGRAGAARRRAVERHEQERRAPDASPDDLRRQQRRELDDMDRDTQKERAAREQKKRVPRKVHPARPPTKQGPRT